MTASKVRDFLLVASSGDIAMPLHRMLLLLEVAAVAQRVPAGVVPWVGQHRLAERLGLPHTTVSRNVTALEEAGLVIRGESKRDRRLTTVRINTRGRALLARAAKAAA